MIQIQVTDYIMLVAFWLSFSRWLAVIMQLPIMEHTSIPVPVKILSTLVITYAFFPATSAEVVKDIRDGCSRSLDEGGGSCCETRGRLWT